MFVLQGNPADAVILEGAFTVAEMPKGYPHPFTWVGNVLGHFDLKKCM